MHKSRPYLFYGETRSLCGECAKVVPAKIIFQDGNVYFRKWCRDHGFEKVLVSTDIPYYKRCQDYLKPGDMPRHFQTQIDKGCPHDCGLCPDHEQHSCLALFEIIDECNMRCPVCFASSGPGLGNARSRDEIEAMLSTLVKSEGVPDLVQVSGGEPTLHPDILWILHRLKDSPIRHLMLNTNGLRLAEDEAFVKALASLKPGFEVYLQFDSLRAEALKALRGFDARSVRLKALAQLEEYGISTTLVSAIRKGVNDDEIGALIDFARGYRCVRGVTLQPVQNAGRNEGFNPSQRLTLSEVRQRIIEAPNPFGDDDLIPLPCHPERIGIGYALKIGDQLQPISGLLPREELLKGAENTITLERNENLREAYFKLFSLGSLGEGAENDLQTMLCCLPKFEAPDLSYENVFRIVIMSFMDRDDFCLGSVKRSCVHFVEPSGRIYPFETWNLFYRHRGSAV